MERPDEPKVKKPIRVAPLLARVLHEHMADYAVVAAEAAEIVRAQGGFPSTGPIYFASTEAIRRILAKAESSISGFEMVLAIFAEIAEKGSLGENTLGAYRQSLKGRDSQLLEEIEHLVQNLQEHFAPELVKKIGAHVMDSMIKALQRIFDDPRTWLCSGPEGGPEGE